MILQAILLMAAAILLLTYLRRRTKRLASRTKDAA